MRIIILKKRIVLLSILLLLILSIIFIFDRNDSFNTFHLQESNEPIRNGDPSLNKMAFTCNVDWGNEEIPKLLKVLEEKGIKITFFVTGRWATNNPELLKMIYNKGHEIGNHGYSHKMHSKISEEDNYNEIKRTEDSIMKILNIKPKYFAPPAGDFDQTTLAVARKMGYKTILWSIDTIDWKEGSTADIIINRVMRKLHHGAILLMHPKPATVEALPYLIDKIRAEGIEIGTVSDLLE